MFHTKKITSRDENEIKLYYRLFFTEKNILISSREDWSQLTKDSGTQFANEILEDLQNSSLSDGTIEKINTAIEKGELYFKVYRDDEDKIPEDSFLLKQVRILPNRGLLDLDKKFQTKISDWTPSFVTQAIDTISDWAWSNLPALTIHQSEIFSAQSEEEYFSADELDEESDEIVSQTLSQDTESESSNLKLTSEEKYSSSFFNQTINAARQLISYAAQNPAKAITFLLSAQVVVTTALNPTTRSNSPLSPQDKEQASQKKSNSDIQLSADNLLTQTTQQIAPASIALSSLNGTNGFKLIGDVHAQGTGYSVSSVGDINGDGIADMLVGVPYTNKETGIIYVVFGQKSGWPASLSLDNLNGTNGFTLIGNPTDVSGLAVSEAGDVNDDGVVDMLIGQMHGAYVVFGKKSNWPPTFLLSNLNGTNGFKLTNTGYDDRASSVSGAGDINGDGIGDMLISVPYANKYTGIIYVVFGKNSSWSPTLSLESLDGTNGFTITNNFFASYCGLSVSKAGDINGDGIADILIGCMYRTFVIFGQKGNWPANFSLASIQNGTNGFALTDGGYSVHGGTDFNGDGITDMLIGSGGNSASYPYAYIVFGQKGIWPATFLLSNLNGTNGFKLIGCDTGLGASGPGVFTGSGDINADGIADILIGCPGMNNGLGTTYVVFGQKSGWPASLSLTHLNGVNGFEFTGNFDRNIFTPANSGFSVSKAGDVNGDGIMDMLIGAPALTGSGIGNVYVVFGHQVAAEFYTNILTIQQGMTHILTAANLNATYNCTDISQIIFTVENVQFGQFEWVTQPGIPVFSFQQQQVWEGQLQFVHDGSLFPPAYVVRMYITEFFNTTAYTPSTIYFTPALFQNQLTVNQGQSVVLNPNNLNATYQNILPENLLFSITALQHGQFYWTGLMQLPITVFSYQNVIEGKVQFTADGSTYIPHYSVSVLINNVIQTGAIPGKINFYLGPVLQQNILVINQGQTIALSSANFNATDSYANITFWDIVFDILSVQHGYFSFITSSQTSINRFSQENITKQVVQFTQDNTAFKPTYFFTVTGSYDTQLGPIAGIVDFDPFPILIRNQLNLKQAEAVILSSDNLNATHNGKQEGNLLFNIINLAHGYLYYVKNPDNFITSFYQDNISNSQVVFLQDGTIETPLFQVSVTDGRTSSAYEQAKISFQLTPIPAPISTPNSKTSLDDFLVKGLISGAISGVIGLVFLAVKIYLSQKAQKKLNQITEEKEGVGKDLAEYRNNVIRPVARTIFERVKLSACLGYVSDETMTDYLSAIETLVSALSRRGLLDGFDTLSVPEQHQIIHEVAKQTKQILVPTIECCSSANFFRFFRPEITPADIEKNAGKIVDCVATALQESIITEDGGQELNTLSTRADVSEKGDPLTRPLLGMV